MTAFATHSSSPDTIDDYTSKHEFHGCIISCRLVQTPNSFNILAKASPIFSYQAPIIIGFLYPECFWFQAVGIGSSETFFTFFNYFLKREKTVISRAVLYKDCYVIFNSRAFAFRIDITTRGNITQNHDLHISLKPTVVHTLTHVWRR